MSRVRLILACLLMAAVPLQGWAAATMLFCGPVQQAAHAHMHGGADTGHQVAHSAHHHDVQSQPHADAHATSHPAHAAGDEAHACSACAACSHSVALAQTPWSPAAPAIPRADLAEPLVAVLAQPSPVPDKPPRA